MYSALCTNCLQELDKQLARHTIMNRAVIMMVQRLILTMIAGLVMADSVWRLGGTHTRM